ncbi:MBL fold metallo-hydrolase [Clostridium grantii]|uniref:L-ascorbate metabolism protein UlaG, beta-lactamase superfamily n=1 Tax=Clostridium grantii DSM 8605 TaxID=1121316 RepID=A0A1M5WKI0_9CLOT|nr:MBL fold metallo-hydrolase [Clostridium grantii]SHH88015.1 L-ascorbate metabolism protein UlaG, beta-lactamase superfamily [Clostridium grantii DSM 8605]
MKITLIAHSCFLLEDSKNRKVITDPYDNTIGHKVYNQDANSITISHNHFDHCYTKQIQNSPKILNKVGLFNLCDIDIEGLPSFHDNDNGAKRGTNVIYIINMDGYRICHLGDLGHSLSTEIIEKIGAIDVLLIPVGGNFTIDAKEAATLCKKIKSHIVIPMHYKTPKIDFPIDGVENFIIEMKNAKKIDSCTLELKESLYGENNVIILNYRN